MAKSWASVLMGQDRRGEGGPQYSTGFFHTARNTGGLGTLSVVKPFVQRGCGLVYSPSHRAPGRERPRKLPNDQGQANLSTQRSTPCEAPRVPLAYAHEGRPVDPGSAPSEGTRPPVRVGGAVRSAEIRRIYSEGRSLHADRVVVFFAPGTGRSATVAARRIGGAVERNRARRILRAAWRQIGPRADLDVVLVAREAIRGAKTQELVVEMTDLLRHGGPAS
jgi:ribonuclease P protein component